MRNIGQMMKQAQALQEKMAIAQEKLNEMEVTGATASEKVTITVNGKGELKAIKIDPSVVDAEDTEMLEDLIMVAFRDAKEKSEKLSQEEMKGVTGGMNIPGLKMPF